MLPFAFSEKWFIEIKVTQLLHIHVSDPCLAMHFDFEVSELSQSEHHTAFCMEVMFRLWIFFLYFLGSIVWSTRERYFHNMSKKQASRINQVCHKVSFSNFYHLPTTYRLRSRYTNKAEGASVICLIWSSFWNIKCKYSLKLFLLCDNITSVLQCISSKSKRDCRYQLLAKEVHLNFRVFFCFCRVPILYSSYLLLQSTHLNFELFVLASVSIFTSLWYCWVGIHLHCTVCFYVSIHLNFAMLYQ